MTVAAGMDLYIYYRARTADSDALRTSVGNMQRRLSQEYGIVVGLKRRPEEKDGHHTWMEIYQAVPEGFGDILENAVAQARLTSFINGPRHVEYFLDVPPCA